MSDGSKCPVLMTHHDSSFFKTVMESGETLDSESLFQIATEASNEHLQYDENSGMYFDKEKDMYYDPTSSIYYDYKNGTYYRAEFAYLSFRWIFFKWRTVLYFFLKTGKRYRPNSFFIVICGKFVLGSSFINFRS